MRHRSEFLDVFLRGGGPSLELLTAFTAGLLVVAVLGNLLYDLLVHPLLGLWPIGRALLAIVLLVGAAYWLYRRDVRHRYALNASVDETRLAQPCTGLVWMLGPGFFEHLITAIRHHQEHGGASHCWLVMEADNKAVERTYTEVTEQLAALESHVKLHPQYLDKLDIAASYDTVRLILERESEEAGLTVGDLVCDITGGIKPLTAGMILAAITAGSPLEYVETDRDDSGRPISGTARVVAVDASFYLTKADPS